MQDKWKVTVNQTVYLSKEIYVYASDVIGAKSEALSEARLLDDDEWGVSSSEYEVEDLEIV